MAEPPNSALPGVVAGTFALFGIRGTPTIEPCARTTYGNQPSLKSRYVGEIVSSFAEIHWVPLLEPSTLFFFRSLFPLENTGRIQDGVAFITFRFWNVLDARWRRFALSTRFSR